MDDGRRTLCLATRQRVGTLSPLSTGGAHARHTQRTDAPGRPQVRASNLQDLVYKQGQAGVTKASVTIVFDNSDPRTSPVGYEQRSEIQITRQVVIGGRNKYLINGHTAQQSQVQNLFHSVQLNVNNPHFLIMQVCIAGVGVGAGAGTGAGAGAVGGIEDDRKP